MTNRNGVRTHHIICPTDVQHSTNLLPLTLPDLFDRLEKPRVLARRPPALRDGRVQILLVPIAALFIVPTLNVQRDVHPCVPKYGHRTTELFVLVGRPRAALQARVQRALVPALALRRGGVLGH